MRNSLPPRYSARPLPPYTYVPGSGTPHPVSDPRGHLYGIIEAKPKSLDPEHWRECETYLYAVDLFNCGFYWEAHEAWESLWHAAGHRGMVADFLKGLIKLAAAGVKQLEGKRVGVQRHLRRGSELLSGVAAEVGTPLFCGLNVGELSKLSVESVEHRHQVRLESIA